MQNIAQIRKYKDIVSLIYLHLHQMYTKDMIREFRVLLTSEYFDEINTYSLLHHGSESHELIHSCFNWRSKQAYEMLDRVPIHIHHITHKDFRLKRADIEINYKYF